MTVRVCIPTAGTGSRLGPLTSFINKSLVAVDNRPTVAHIIELYPDDTEFVIALGHKGNLVREFLSLAYPDRTFYFAEVSLFEGPGSGLGLTLLACRSYLQQPFIFHSCDTLTSDVVTTLTENWIAYSDSDELVSYRTVRLENSRVVSISEKDPFASPLDKPYIGVAGIHNFSEFWHAMESGGIEAIEQGECFGLRALLPRKIFAHHFSWYDTGNPEKLENARNHFQTKGGPTILHKSNEAIWFVGDRVIKFSDDSMFISNRVARASALGRFVPQITGQSMHMYAYDKVDGVVLSECATPSVFRDLLTQCEDFWSIHDLGLAQVALFQTSCRKFYQDKTAERVDLFYRSFSKRDLSETINGEEMPTLRTLLDAVDWQWLSQGLPGRFHGDFHFENILWCETEARFTFLDWRQDFAGDLNLGDIYYDFAKLLHGLIVNHGIVAAEHFSIEWTDQAIRFDFHRKQSLVHCEHMFYRWLRDKGFDTRRVKLLTSIIYLNIAALHHNPYSLFLYALGKQMLSECLAGFSR
jgi:NDP-sugar pyrophosphorylase family protein